MTEPDQIEFDERVNVSSSSPDARSIPNRIGIVAGLAITRRAAPCGHFPASRATTEAT